MRLVEKRKRFESDPIVADEEPQAEVIDAFNDTYVDNPEDASPMFDLITAENSANPDETFETSEVIEQSPAESSVRVSSSRLANMLRRTANRLDSSSERLDDVKAVAKKKLGAFGRAALRGTSALDEFALGASAAVAEKGVAIGTNLAAKGLAVTDRADTALVNKAAAVGATVKNKYGNALESATGNVADLGVALLDGKDKITGSIENVKTGAKNRLTSLKEASLKRRQARRAFYASTKEYAVKARDRSVKIAVATGPMLEKGMDAVGTKMMSGQEAVAGKIERGKTSIEATRARGRAILELSSDARLDQNQL